MKKSTSYFIALCALFSPLFSHAQLSVPVTAAGTAASAAAGYSGTLDTNDSVQSLTMLLERYTVGDENRSLRALLGGNPSDIGAVGLLHPKIAGNEIEEKDDTVARLVDKEVSCKLRHIADTRKGVPREGGSWDYLIKNGAFLDGTTDPTNMSDADFAKKAAQAGSFSSVMVNDSRSLSCLFQEAVEWQKLSINLQIHQLLRDQIAAAQARSVASHLKGMNSAAITKQAESANSLAIRDEDGDVVETSNFPAWTDPKVYACELIKRRAKTMVDSVLHTEDPYRFDTARAIYAEQDKQCDSLLHFQENAGNTLVNSNDTDAGLFESQSDVAAFYAGDSSKAKRDPLTTFQAAFEQRNSPVGAGIDAVSRLREMASEIQETVAQRYQAGSGFLPVEECPAGSKNCDPSELKIVTPGKLEAEAVGRVAGGFDDQISKVDSLESLAALDTKVSTAALVGDGFTNFDSSQYTQQSPIYEYVREFYNGIRNGYFDIQPGTTDWATGAMLSIFDNIVTDPHVFREPSEANLTDSSQIPEPVEPE